MASHIEGQGADVPECLFRDGKYIEDGLFDYLLENSRDFTEEEAKAYKEGLRNIYKPIGVNIFDLSENE